MNYDACILKVAGIEKSIVYNDVIIFSFADEMS